MWHERQRIERIHDPKPILGRVSASSPWEEFRVVLDPSYAQKRKSNAGQKRPCHPVQDDGASTDVPSQRRRSCPLAVEEFVFQLKHRRPFPELVGLGLMNKIPDATTIAFFRERL